MTDCPPAGRKIMFRRQTTRIDQEQNRMFQLSKWGWLTLSASHSLYLLRDRKSSLFWAFSAHEQQRNPSLSMWESQRDPEKLKPPEGWREKKKCLGLTDGGELGETRKPNTFRTRQRREWKSGGRKLWNGSLESREGSRYSFTIKRLKVLIVPPGFSLKEIRGCGGVWFSEQKSRRTISCSVWTESISPSASESSD